MTALTAMPMDEDALESLAALLDERAWPHGGMSLEMLDGFFSALVVGPVLVPPSEYLPQVWGEAPDWETIEQAQQAIESLMRFWNHIVWRVAQPIPDEGAAGAETAWRVLPAMALPEPPHAEDDAQDPLAALPEDFPLGLAWASGFLQGVQLRPDTWEAWLDPHEDLQAAMGMILHLADIDEPMGIQDRLQAWMALPDTLQQMYLQGLDDRRPQPIRREAAPGRNDPCPCGSGRKYKKCCGGAGQLH